MQTIPYFHIDAFTSRLFGGNPAGVFPIRYHVLKTGEMKTIRPSKEARRPFGAVRTRSGVDPIRVRQRIQNHYFDLRIW